MITIEAIKESWGWAGIEPEEIVGENDFGNLMIRDIHGRYWQSPSSNQACRAITDPPP
jgi:hypothetical protein